MTRAASACIDTRLSLGSHSAPAVHGDDASVSDPLDGSIAPPNMMGGAGGQGGTGGMGGMGGMGGAPPMLEPDAGPTPVQSPCEGATYDVELGCQVDEGGFGQPAGRPPQPMMTTTTLTLTAHTARQEAARGTAVLAFEAWGLVFAGRIEGELDCARGTFRALIVDGQVTSPGVPPGPFFGQIDGLLDPTTNGIAGPWWHGPDPQAPNGCIGAWSATLR